MKPAELATKVDAFKAFREKRLSLAKEVEALKAEEARLKEELIELFSDSEVSTIGGKLAIISLVQKTKPVATDWPALHKHILDSGDFDLLQRKLGESAVKARWEDGEDVPGVETKTFYDLSVRKP